MYNFFNSNFIELIPQKRKSTSSIGGSSGLEWGSHLLIGDNTSDSVGLEDVGGGEPPPPKMIKKKRKDIPAEEKKICLWVLEDGTACGKTFTKFDSLKRHVSEAHKGVRPFSCSLCGKNYGRRDYLLRHLKSHNETDVSAGMSSSPPQIQMSSSRLMGSSSQMVRVTINSRRGPQWGFEYQYSRHSVTGPSVIGNIQLPDFH